MTSASNTRTKVLESINNAGSNQYFKRLLSRRVTKNATKEEARAELKNVVSERAADIITGGSSRKNSRTRLACTKQDDLFEDFPTPDRCPSPEPAESELEIAVKAGRRLLNVLAETPFLWAVQNIVEQCPDSVRAVNAVGRTPLHVASVHGASSDVLLYLVQAFPQACQVADSYGMTPLHYVAHSSYWTKTGKGVLWGNGGGDFAGPTYCDLVKLMIQAYPGALALEDEDDCNPIEYAVLHNAPLDVVKTLQRASVRLNKTQDKLDKSLMSVGSSNVAQGPLPPKQVATVIGRAA